jgi:hypothetical protein
MRFHTMPLAPLLSGSVYGQSGLDADRQRMTAWIAALDTKVAR